MGCCLIVIDMQKGVFGLKRPVYHERELIEHVKTAVRLARQSGFPVMFSLHENNTFLQPDTPGHGLRNELDILPGDTVIRKKHPDVFAETNLEEILEKNQISTIIIAGLISNGCVRCACLAALAKGFRVVLVKDAHSTFFGDPAKIIEQINTELEAAGARIVAAGELSAATLG